MTTVRDQRRVLVRTVLALAALTAFLWLGAARAVEPFHTYLYLFCWIPFIAAWHAVFRYQAGRSFLDGKISGSPAARWTWFLFLSATAWLAFELINVRLGNWAYEGLPRTRWIRWPGYAASFATVFPGILIMAGVLANARPARADAPSANGAVGRRWSVPAGAAMLALPLLAPRIFFPLVWGALFFLLEPAVQALGGHSLLRDWKARRFRTTSALLLAGLIAGFFWEACNYGAGARWIYTVPHVNFWKLFEMPLLGYLGFPAFALEVFVIFEAARLVWPRLSRARKAWAIAGCLALWIVAFWAIDTWTVRRWR